MKLPALFRRKKAERQFDAGLLTRPVARRQNGNAPPIVSGGLRPFDADIVTSLSRMRAVCRHAYENDGYARRAVRLARAQVVGPEGLRLQLEGDGADAVQDAWAEHSGPGFGLCGASRADIERAMLASQFFDGESLAELTQDGRVSLIDAARVPVDVWGDPNVRMGVQYDANRRPLRYAVQSIDTSRQAYSLATYRRDSVRWIAAENMAHVYDRGEFAEASRGVPRLAVAVGDSEMLRDYRNAELSSAQLQARNRGFLVDSETGRNAVRSDARRVQQDGAGQSTAVVSDDLDDSTMLYRLPYGVTYQSAQSDHPSRQYADFVRASLRSYGAATGTAFSQLSNDISGANFSSLRSERLVQDALHDEDAALLAQQFTSRVFHRWLQANARRLTDVPLAAVPALLRSARFVKPTPKNLQPREEERARELRLALGVTSPQQEILAAGGDPARVLRERIDWARLTQGLNDDQG